MKVSQSLFSFFSSFFLMLIILLQGLGELQTKLANLILGLKTQPELDQLAQSSAPVHAPQSEGWPRSGGGGDSGGWDTAGAGGGSSSSAGWGNTSPSRTGGSSGWGNLSPTRGGAASGAWVVSPNANGANTATWGPTTSSGWQSPNEKTNTGWNI